MTTRTLPPPGGPCWADLWTSDVDGSRRFYGEVLGWGSDEPDPAFGGYFMFTRQGVPVAGGMGAMGDANPDNAWKAYLASDDIGRTVAEAEAAGGQVALPPMAVADLGTQAVLLDPTGAAIGVWEPGTFPGFTILGEHGAPSWFELHTGDHAAALAFYRSVFGWELDLVSDTDQFRYATAHGADGDFAGINDAAPYLAEGESSSWSIYWEVDDVDTALATASGLGGVVLRGAEDSPYGRLATAADPAGALFRLRTSPH